MTTRAAHKHAATKTKSSKHTLFDFIVYFFMIATPLFELPQAITIFTRHSATDVSLWTWAFFCIDNLVWITYAVRQKLLPVLLTSILYEAIEILVVVGILLYR
jgi:uncharacterized protein with PQ loop repeat